MLIVRVCDIGIYISGTTKYFFIRNCYVDAEEYGIYIYNVADGTETVINNTCNNNNIHGIKIEFSGSSTVANNTCSNNGYGIALAFSGSTTVANNTCSNNYRGIYFYYSDFCAVTYNLLQGNEGYGVYLGDYSDNNLILHNTFVDNYLVGKSQAYNSGKSNKWYDSEAKEGNYCHLRLPSGEVRLVHVECKATIGQVGNIEHENISLGKAGRKRWLGRRPKVRGVAMNPVDHPMGGGEGKSSGGRHPCTPWGKPTKGFKTRKKKKASSKYIIKRRK